MKKEMNNSENNNSETAQKIMVKDFPVVSPNSTVSNVEKILLEKTKDFETISYIYVKDKKKLVGIISIKEVFRCKKSEKVKNIMKKDIISVRPKTDQERAAYLCLKNNLKAIPVVDKNNVLLGIIPNKKIMKVLHQEHIEDILYDAGVHKFKDPEVEIISASTKTHFKKRLPWLVLGLIGGILAAVVVGFFEGILETYILLAAFIPAVVYMADAVGNQAQTIFIRSMALEKKLNMKKYLLREVLVNFLLGTVLGTLFFLILFYFWRAPFFGAVLGISIFSAIMVAMAVSMILPIIFQKMKSDPAISSGPLATATRDLIALLVYFGIANLMVYFFL